ncbi:MAG: ferritin family protein [Bacteroidetes bacterium]|nr:ferritin family protein [Bacteroidota bacterium]
MYYSGQEIIEIAVRIEQNGYDYYITAAKNIKAPNDIKNLFLDLAEMEVHHSDVFQKLSAQFEAENFEFDQDEAAGYINFLADSHIFGKKDAGGKIAKDVSSPKEALELALKFEKDSVAFYEELYKKAKNDARKMIMQIIDEEKSHVALISRFL